MGTISITTPSDGQTADAADVATPLNTIVNEINGNLDNANIKSGAAIDGSKLADNSLELEAKVSDDTGWREVTDSWAYASATTITVPSDATTKYSVGDKIRLTQTTVKYFYVTAVAATTLTVTGGSDYTVANAAITSISYSKVETPLGFPRRFAFTPSYANITTTSGTNVGYFKMVGTLVFVRTKFTLGASSAVSANPTMTLPITSVDYGATLTDFLGQAYLQGSLGAVRWNNTTTVDFTVWNSTSTYLSQNAINSTVNVTWATSNVLSLDFYYEAA